MKSGVAPRVAAAQNLHRILAEGAHSNVLLDQPGELHGRDRSTVHRLTFDTLRWLPLVDWQITSMAGRPVESLDPPVQNVLRIALTELHTGGDPHGVVDSAVEAVRVLGSSRASGFVNALCRRIVRGEDVPTADGVERDALRRGLPVWIWERLVAEYGAGEADALAAGLQETPLIGIRLRREVSEPPGEPVDGIPTARLVGDRRAVERLDDAAMVMDPASTAVALAVGVQPGDRVLDVAAAPGNKTAAMWDAMAGDGTLVAADAHPRRTKRARQRLKTLGVGAPWVVADGATPPFRNETFDRILLDAPCTGLGTLRRRPEIKTRLDPSAPATLARLQRTLLERSLELLKPGGRLVYAVCTIFAEETVDVVSGLDARPPENLPGAVTGDGVLLTPHGTGTDAMFIAVIGS